MLIIDYLTSMLPVRTSKNICKVAATMLPPLSMLLLLSVVAVGAGDAFVDSGSPLGMHTGTSSFLSNKSNSIGRKQTGRNGCGRIPVTMVQERN